MSSPVGKIERANSPDIFDHAANASIAIGQSAPIFALHAQPVQSGVS
jgi:hypothetical protein